MIDKKHFRSYNPIFDSCKIKKPLHVPYLLALQRLSRSSRSCVTLLPFAFFLNCFHGAFGDELIISSETAAFMQVIRKLASGVDRHKALIFNLRKVHTIED
jgi:uncharacterized membrane protein